MNRRALVAVIPALLLAACGSAGPGSPRLPVAEAPSPSPSAVGSSPADASPSAAIGADLAPFERIDLVDVRTGDHFNLGGFQGKQVIIEGMATW